MLVRSRDRSWDYARIALGFFRDQRLPFWQMRNADGIVFCAASFCDPALLDRPQLQKACDEAGIAHINFQFHENTGQFKVIKEQAGTFSDSIKLWV